MMKSNARPARGRALLSLMMWTIGLTIAGCGGGGGGGNNMPRAAASLAVQPGTIVLGQSATLTWNSSTGSTCTAGGQWNGSKAASGSQAVTPAAAGSLTYSLTCTAAGYRGSGRSSVTLIVTAPTAFSNTLLVADTDGLGALSVDANLVNAWGIAFGPTTPVWVANNHTETSTLYDGNGKPQPFSAPRVVQLPDGAGGGSFDPTGIVFNGSTDFVITAGANSAPARFIFDGEGGVIAGWASGVNASSAVIVYTDAGGAIYKGLAIASNGTANFLYATDFHNAKIDVFDSTFTKQVPTATSFSFVDPTLPAGYAPFGIQAIKNGPGGTTQLYVSYAEQAGPSDPDNVNGPGLGLVDVFDANGNFVAHLVPAGGLLNAPWGMALAPADFGTLSNALLVGNFGDGMINGYNATTGAYIGTVRDAGGAAFAVPGLWGVAFGNDAGNQPHNTLFWAAGTNDEANGAYGRIDVGATPPLLNTPPDVAVTGPAGSVSGTVTVTATAVSPLVIAKVEFFLNGTTSLGVVTAPPYSVSWDTTTIADGTVTLTATATDVDGNVGTSPGKTVTVANTAPTVTLSELQTLVFTPICSVCHNGTGVTLPGSQDLRAGHSFASLVDVASVEKPALKRVNPGDPANSYLVMKLEGAAGISGVQMPQGGPPLSQATIDKVKAWIAAGALNN